MIPCRGPTTVDGGKVGLGDDERRQTVTTGGATKHSEMAQGRNPMMNADESMAMVRHTTAR